MMDPLRVRIIPLSLTMKMTNLLCSQHQERLWKKGVTQVLMTETLHQCAEERDIQYGKASTSKLEQDVSGNSRERSKNVSILGRKAEGEVLRNIVNKLSGERNF